MRLRSVPPLPRFPSVPGATHTSLSSRGGVSGGSSSARIEPSACAVPPITRHSPCRSASPA